MPIPVQLTSRHSRISAKHSSTLYLGTTVDRTYHQPIPFQIYINLFWFREVTTLCLIKLDITIDLKFGGRSFYRETEGLRG